MQDDKTVTIRDLYPYFTQEQLDEAEANLRRYLSVMLRIAERLRSEGYCLTDPDLTRSRPSPTIHDERSNSQKIINDSFHKQS